MRQDDKKNGLSPREKASFLFHYYGEWQFRKKYLRYMKKKLRSKRYAGKTVADSSEGNLRLLTMIQKGEPFMAGRFGSVELSAVVEVLRSECLNKKYDFRRLEDLNRNAGFTGKRAKEYDRFAHLMIESTKKCDFMGVWYNQMENWLCRQYMPSDSFLTHRNVYDFWNYEMPFTAALGGKKVLIIHPYSESILSQYEKRERIFENKSVLPGFDLQVIKAVQTLGDCKDERFDSWFEALEYMYQEAMAKEFDIALIGCGAYGFPLAAKIKAAGKMAIHMGGVLQILFGIKGRRWDVLPDVNVMYNDDWVRPCKEESIFGKEQIEGGCYW